MPPPLRAHAAELRRTLDVRRVYADLDGTMLGPGGSLFADPSAGVTAEPALAVAALAQAGVALVLMSGRTANQLRETGRLVGARAVIAELGALTIHQPGGEEEIVRDPGAYAGSGTVREAIERTGAAGFLLERFAGRLEPHAMATYADREGSVELRGVVDLPEARRALKEAGYGWLDLRDNGTLHAGRVRFPQFDADDVHVYHLLARGVSKRSAVAADRRRAELEPRQCLAVGDGASDAEVAVEVGAVVIVANGERATRGLPLAENVYLAERSHGLGFVDAVHAVLDGPVGGG